MQAIVFCTHVLICARLSAKPLQLKLAHSHSLGKLYTHALRCIRWRFQTKFWHAVDMSFAFIFRLYLYTSASILQMLVLHVYTNATLQCTLSFRGKYSISCLHMTLCAEYVIGLYSRQAKLQVLV